MSYKNGNAKLAAVLQKRMQGVSSFCESPGMELGEISGSGSLKIDNFTPEIPAGEYLICIPAGGSGGSPAAGSRVLVAWAGGEPVVLGCVRD